MKVSAREKKKLGLSLQGVMKSSTVDAKKLKKANTATAATAAASAAAASAAAASAAVSAPKPEAGANASEAGRTSRPWTLAKRGLRPDLRMPPLLDASTPPARFRYIFHVLVGHLELPVTRADILTDPHTNPLPDGVVALAGRQAVYDFVLHNAGPVERALHAWLGQTPTDTLKLNLMRHQLVVAGMEVTDFSRFARPLVPLSADRWRADGNTVTVLMREIAIFKDERDRKNRALAHMSTSNPDAFQKRQWRVRFLADQLAEVGLTVEDLPWAGPEPTRMTYNQLVARGDQDDPEATWQGLAPCTTLDRWNSGVRRLKLEKALAALQLDPNVCMRDERALHQIMVFVELDGGDAEVVARSIQSMFENKQSQWTRRKRRTDRWAFNFDYPTDVDEADNPIPPVLRRKQPRTAVTGLEFELEPQYVEMGGRRYLLEPSIATPLPDVVAVGSSGLTGGVEDASRKRSLTVNARNSGGSGAPPRPVVDKKSKK